MAASRAATFAADERAANPTIPLPGMSSDDVTMWASTLNLPASIPTALAARNTDGAALARLTQAELREGLLEGQRMKLGHVHRLLNAIEALAAEGWAPVGGISDGPAAAGADGAQLAELEAIGGGVEGQDPAADDFGEQMSAWAGAAGPEGPEAVPPAQGTLGPAGVDEASSEAEAARGARLAGLAGSDGGRSEPEPEPEVEPGPGAEPQPEPQPEPEPQPGKQQRAAAKKQPKGKKYSLDYSRFASLNSDSDSDGDENPAAEDFSAAQARLAAERPVQLLPRGEHIALGEIHPQAAAVAIAASLKARGVCVCDAGAARDLLQGAMREALTCLQGGLLRPPDAGSEAAWAAQEASGVSTLLTSSPSRSEAMARNPLLLELEGKIEALAFGIAGLLRAEAGVEIRSRSAGVLTSLAVGVSCSCRSFYGPDWC